MTTTAPAAVTDPAFTPASPKAAKKLAADARAAGLHVKVSRGDRDVFLIVTVANRATGTMMFAEWWDGPTVREFNYAATASQADKTAGTRRAPSLKAARAHVGL